MPAALPKGVYRRPESSVYQLRITVPTDIKDFWQKQPNGSPASNAYRGSLGTSDPLEAAAKATEIWAEYLRRLQAIRDRNREPTPTPTPITDRLTEYIAMTDWVPLAALAVPIAVD